MMSLIVGRKEESLLLEKYYESANSEFIVVYGRRRVGKTFLIKNYFKDSFFLSVTGSKNQKKSVQINGFLKSFGSSNKLSDWSDAFFELRTKILNSDDTSKKVIFFDEISWFSTNKSYFLPSFEHFWNDFCSTRDDICLIVCGSESAWINKNIFNNRGGFHNRVTGKIHMKPFTLDETFEYIKHKKITVSELDALNAYMVLGGVPYYYNFMDKNLSLSQNIDKLFFLEDSILKNEFDSLFDSLFVSSLKCKLVVEKLGKKL
jgi:predicted AAA+ superfamily ATPase